MSSSFVVSDLVSSIPLFGLDLPAFASIFDCPSVKNPFSDSESVLKRQGLEVKTGHMYTSSSASGTFVSNKNLNGSEKERKAVKSENRKESYPYRHQDFLRGEIVWVKCSKRFPAWPAIVIDAKQEAPASDYAWVKDGMILPFLEYLERFQGQTQLYGSKPDDFRKAIEEAYLIENGNLKSYGDKKECSTDFGTDSDFDSNTNSDTDSDPDLVEIEVGTATEHHLEYFKSKKNVYIQKEKQPYESYGLIFPSETLKKALCEQCSKANIITECKSQPSVDQLAIDKSQTKPS